MDEKRRKRARREELVENVDMLGEIFKYLDAESLGCASCVCKKWKEAASEESLWERICSREWPSASSASPPSGSLKSVVSGLGGFRRLYLNYLHPLLSYSRTHSAYKTKNDAPTPSSARKSHKPRMSKDGMYLSLSLFSIGCYAKLGKPSMPQNSAVGKLMESWKTHWPCSTMTSASTSTYKPKAPEPQAYCWGSMDNPSSSSQSHPPPEQ